MDLQLVFLNHLSDYNASYKVAIINYLTYMNYHCDEDIYKISEYAKKDCREFFSESFVMYRLEKQNLPDANFCNSHTGRLN